MGSALPSPKPSISVLMPAHNAERTIKAAVRSALLALPRDGELICFVDGCSDRTFDVLRSISDSRLRVELSEQNLGIVAARRRLIELSRAEYVANLDADDIALPWRFKAQLRRLRAGSCDFLFMNAILFGSSLRPFVLKPQWPVSLDERQSDLALTFSNPFVNSSFAGLKKFVVQLQGFTGNAEDYVLWLNAAEAGVRMRRMAAYGVLYRVHEQQTTKSERWQKLYAVDDSLNSLRAKHLERLSSQEKTTSFELSQESVFDEYAHSSWMLFLQNIGLKRGLSTWWSKRFRR